MSISRLLVAESHAMKLILITLVAVVVGMMVGCTAAPTPTPTPYASLYTQGEVIGFVKQWMTPHQLSKVPTAYIFVTVCAIGEWT